MRYCSRSNLAGAFRANNVSVPKRESADYAGFDKPGKIVLADVEPAQMNATLVAMTKRPGVTGEPGVIQSWQAALLTAESLTEGDDFEANSFRIGEAEFVLAFIEKASAFVGDAIKAPGAKPITARQTNRGVGAAFVSRFSYTRQDYFWAG